MSNYLQSLIARARSHGSHLEPRRRSVFEPVGPDAYSPPGSAGTDLAGPTVPSDSGAAPDGDVLAAPPAASTALPTGKSRTPVTGLLRPAEFSANERWPQPPAADAGEERGEALLQPQHPPGVEPTAPLRSMQPARRRDPGPLARTDPPAGAEPAGYGNAGAPAAGAAQPVPGSVPAEARIASVRPRVSVPPGPLKAAVPAATRPGRQARSGDTAPPAIQVTIGRVEVRAIYPGAAPAPSRSERPAPKITLEKYLEARNGGDR